MTELEKKELDKWCSFVGVIQLIQGITLLVIVFILFIHILT